MSRLIDADALSEKLCKTTIFIKDGEVFQRMINDAPTVSAETVDCTDFVLWLLDEIMDEEMWELNAVANGEVIARKLKKLGLLKVKDGYYIRSSVEAAPPVLTCDGCRHVGTYDTDFPCSGCIRREKDYYEQER